MKKILPTTLFLLMGLAAWADELPTITVVYSGETATVTIPAGITDVTSEVDDADVTLYSTNTTKEYRYVLSGSTDNGSFELTDTLGDPVGDYKPTIELNNLTLKNKKSAAFTVYSDKRAAIILVGDNLIEDGKKSDDAAMFIKSRPEFDGTGTLTINGKGKHGIKTKKGIEIKGGTITISANSDGIHFGNDKYMDDEKKYPDYYFLMDGGSLTFGTVGSDLVDDDGSGNILIEGGTINGTITDGNNGFKAYHGVSVTGGEINLTIPGVSAKGFNCSTFSMTGGTVNGTASGAGSRVIKTDGAFTMNGGNLTATLSGGNADDGEGGIDHCTGIKVANSDVPADMTVSGGTISFTMANDEAESFDCKGTFSITGKGEINLTGTKYAVDSEDFQNDMRAYVKVNLNGTDFGQYDYRKCQIGAYMGSTLCGGGTTKITPDGTYIYLPIYSNSTNGVVNFRVQNYDEGTLTEYTAGNFCQFSNDGELATPSSPFELDIYSLNELTIGDDVAYTRTVTNAFGTVVLPFVPTSHENVKLYTISEVEDSVLTLSEVTDPVANTPYIFKVSALTGAPCDITFSAPATALVVPEGTPSNSMAGYFTMYGTYKQKAFKATEAVNDIYYISGNTFWHATGTLAVKPYRTWFEVPKASQVKVYAIVIDGQATGIAEVEDGEMQLHFGEIYDLQGRRVTNPQSGQIYIVNGKKILY